MEANGSGSDNEAYYDEFAKRAVAASMGRRSSVAKGSTDPFVKGPCFKEDYNKNYGTNQLNTCTQMATDFLDIPELSDIKGIYSHAFDRRTLDPRDQTIYFHLSFSGKMPNKTTRFFFAEITGFDGPERVSKCEELLNSRSTTKNFMFCTGIKHPISGDFVGHKG